MKKLDRILLIDDDPIANHHNANLIAKHDFADEVVIKTNGKDALFYLENVCQSSYQFPDLILLDIKMPVLDGFEFLKEFEGICRNVKQDIYVVILTTSKDADDIIKLREFGQLHFVNKPLTIDHLIDINHKFFRDSPQGKNNWI